MTGYIYIYICIKDIGKQVLADAEFLVLTEKLFLLDSRVD